MVVFRHENEPRKNHALQVWQTPYVGKDFQSAGNSESELFKIGNKDIVDCIAACRGICKMVQKGDSYQSVYFDIVKESQSILDAYFWIDNEEAFNLSEVLKEIKDTSTFAIGEFEKVTRIKNATRLQIEAVSKETESLLQKLEYGTFDTVNEYVDVLGEIRNLRGRIVSLNDLMYTDKTLVESLDDSIKDKNEIFSTQCVKFLISPDGLKPMKRLLMSCRDLLMRLKNHKKVKNLQKEWRRHPLI